MSVFNHLDYKKFLRELIKANRDHRGYQSRLCQAMGCSNSLLSQVVNGEVQLTLEHSHKLGKFLGLNESEHQYLLTLIQYARAGTPDLRDYLLKQLTDLQEKFNQLSTRLSQQKTKLDERGTQIYCRHWSYPAIHIVLNIPRYRRPEAIAELLTLPVAQVVQVLADLKDLGLAKKVRNEWAPGEASLHIPKGSPSAPFIHANWRYRTIGKILERPHDGTHYSGVHAMEAKTYRKIKSELVEILARFRSEIADAKSEELVFMSVDLFQFGSDA